MSQIALLTSHLQEVVDHCLKLAQKGDLTTRTIALQVLRITRVHISPNIMLQVLAACGVVSGPQTVLLAPRVTRGLGPVLSHRKRVVREEAARTRNIWFLVTQP